MTRFRLNKTNLKTETGQQLLQLLMHLTSDGELTADEVTELRVWIEQHGQELGAAAYLKEVLDTVLRDGRITLQDRWDVLQAIQKVLPLEERDLVKIRTRETEEPATQRQREFLTALGVRHSEDLTKWRAAELIDDAKESQRSGSRSRSKKPGCLDTLIGWVILAAIIWGLVKCSGSSH